MTSRWAKISRFWTVRLRLSQEGYAVYCPDLPGCWSQGATRVEALRNIREAIHDYLAAQRALRWRKP
jgi:predicted RNase H-like HicB family nuclease